MSFGNFRKLAFQSIATLALVGALPAAAQADSGDELQSTLNQSERNQYGAAFAAIRAGRWDEAKSRIMDLPRGGLRSIATAELYLAADSPRVEGPDLEALINEAPWLPEGERIANLARLRGATSIPDMPSEKRFSWLGAQPRRSDPKTENDAFTAGLRSQINSRIANDDPAGAEALMNEAESQLSANALTEMRKRVAWSYYIENQDHEAQRLAQLAMQGSGPWATHGEWVYALASWRVGDYGAAQAAFGHVGEQADEPELAAAGLYWSSRAAMASGNPQLVQPLLQTAVRYEETFYGILAAEALGMEPLARRELLEEHVDKRSLAADDKVRLVLSLAELGEENVADETLLFFARTDDAGQHTKYLAAAREIGLPKAQLWLAQNGPAGTQPDKFDRYPAPRWDPEGGWRVDKALVYAHALQESRFRTDAISPAGARGLLQLMPGTARALANARGRSLAMEDLNLPAINLEFGQSYMEMMRDRGETGGLLPKVIAAYNAGPAPVGRWAYEVNDQGDPLLFIESIPYWETRGYVGAVMRNYWMYEAQESEGSTSRTGIAQNMWPRYPGLSGPTAIRLDDQDRTNRIANR